MSFASGCSNPSILGRASRAFWSIAGTTSHSVVAFQRPHPDPGLRRRVGSAWGSLRQRLISVFHVVGFLDVAAAGFRRAESAVELRDALFPGGWGVSRGEARRRRRAWRAPLTAPEPPEVWTNRRSRARRVGRRWRDCADRVDSQRFMSFASGCLNPSDPGPSLSSVLVDSRNNLTFGRRVSATAP